MKRVKITTSVVGKHLTVQEFLKIVWKTGKTVTINEANDIHAIETLSETSEKGILFVIEFSSEFPVIFRDTVIRL